MAVQKRPKKQLAGFNPSDIFEELKNADFDPSIFDQIDERDIPKAPNFLEFVISPKFLNTRILPRQIEIGAKLLSDWCPDCTKPGYMNSLFDQSVGNIRDNVTFLDHGKCPSCKKTRYELVQERKLVLKNELVARCGQRCIPKDSILFTKRGMVEARNVKVGDVLSHGPVIEVVESGVLPMLEIKTQYNFTIRGARDSHLIAVVGDSGEIKFKLMKECVPGDIAVLYIGGVWPDAGHSQIPPKISVEKALYDLVGDFRSEFTYSSHDRLLAKQTRLSLLNVGIPTKCSIVDGVYTITNLSEREISDAGCLLEDGYFPLRIESINELPAVEMVDFVVPGTNCYTADGALVHNSGKTKLVGLLSAYSTHRFLKVSNPLRYFNQPSGELLMGTFSALTADQAAQTLWESYKGFVESSPWFQSYHKFLKSEGKRLGVELLHELKTSTGYTHKQMLWHATGSEDRKMRGRTRVFCSIDELGWFTSDESKPNLQIMNADAVYTALSNSLATMRMKFNQLWSPENYDSPAMIMANISSPSAAKDKIMRLEKSARDNPKMLAVAYATWDMNPDFSHESLRTEFASMPEEQFMRDFGAEPPLAANPFLSDPKVIDKIAYGEFDNNIQIVPVLDKDRMGDGFKSIKLASTVSDKTFPRMICFDLGFRKNALSACIFSLAPDSKPRLDFALAITPETNIPVNIVHFFENFTTPLVSLFNIKHAFFDRWQSLDQIQRLKDMGVDAKVHSLTYKEMDSVRGLILSQGMIIPKMDRPMGEYIKDYIDDKALIQPIPTLGVQLLTVRDLGHRMAKPLMGDDDIFRAFCLGAVALSDPSIKEQYSVSAKKLPTGQSVRALGTIRSLRGDTGGGGSVSGGPSGGFIGTVKTSRNR